MSHTNNCVCGDMFRFEATNLLTGQVQAVLHPMSVDWETPLSEPGQGSMMLATRDISAAQIWPHRTGIYISRVSGNGTREGLFGGIIDKFAGSSQGDTRVGFYSVDGYLDHRVLADDDGGLTYSVTNRQQTLIAQDLVVLGSTSGIPLTASAEPSGFLRDREWNSWEVKNIGEAINELTKVINGVQYDLSHSYALGVWSSVIRFRDEVGAARGIVLRSDREASQYGLDVDAKDHATFVVGVGEGEEVDQKKSVARDGEVALYPRFDAVPAWKDVSIQSTLDSHAIGYVVDHRDPSSTPSVVIAGLDPDPSQLLVGDLVSVDIGYGVVTYRGDARVLSQAWKISAGQAITRTLTLLPTTRPTDSVLFQQPVNDCPEC